MAKKKTLEEIRASQRARAARWREKNARTHRERVAEVYGRSHAQKQFEGGVTPQEVERYGRKVEETHYGGIEGVDMGYVEKELSERGGYGTNEREAGEDSEGAVGGTGERTGGGGVRGVSWADRGIGARGNGIESGDQARGIGGREADELGVGGEDGGGPGEEGGQGGWTANEEATYARLEELKERRARGGLNAGVEVELDI